ncbi:MAG: oligosaccharide flippase family protein [Candidatus Hadarchaeum sp.]|uniref:lipopolysaccharide biosynthesis protein n=1 Tax=Candidatus Hadarchaeum sp. TaxID=2883567 RepID=UPI003172FA01
MRRVAMIYDRLKDVIRVLLPKGRFARSVAVLAGGAALGQAITVLVSPVLTRLYAPEDLGILAVYSSILGIISVIAGWRYELAIPLPEREKDAVNLAMVSLGIVVFMSFLVGFVVWLWGEQIVRWVNAPVLQRYLLILPLGVLLVGSYQVFNYWAVRKQAFEIIARTRLYQGLGAVTTQISLGLLKPLPLGLLLGHVAGQAAGVSTLLRVFWKQAKDYWGHINASDLVRISRRYARFPLFASWAGILNTLGVQIPILLISSLFGTTLTGFYLLSYRVLWLPTQLVSQSISQVLLSAGAEATHKGDAANLAMFVFRRLLLIGVPCFGLIGLLAPDLTPLVFGPNWKEAGLIMQWLVPWIFSVFVASPLSVFSIILEKQPQEACFQGLLLTSRVTALLGGRALDSVHTAIGLFSLVSTLCWIGYLVWIFKLVDAPLRMCAILVIREFIINSFLFSPMILIRRSFPSSVWFLLGAAAAFALATTRVILVLVKEKSDV